MTFIPVRAQADRTTGFEVSTSRTWPQTVHHVDIKLDVWGAGAAADPWTGISQPFNDPAKRVEAEIVMTFPDSHTELHSAQWVGHVDGNFGSQKPGGVQTEPTISLDFPDDAILPLSAILTLRCVAGPVTSGLSIQFS